MVSYFSIGEAVAAFALLITVSQIAAPAFRFRTRAALFSATQFGMPMFVVGMATATMAPLSRSLFAGVSPNWPLHHPLFWELCAGLAFFTGSAFFVRSMAFPVRFRSLNRKRFYNACASVIALARPDALDALARELGHSMGALVRHATNMTRVPPEHGGPSRFEMASWTAEYASAVLDLLTDARFCQAVVTGAPGTATAYFHAMRSHGQYRGRASQLGHLLALEALRNENSILYREASHTSLGRFAYYTNAVYSDPKVLDSSIRPLDIVQTWRGADIAPATVERYMEIFDVAVRAYAVDDGFASYRGLDQAFHVMERLMNGFMNRIDDSPSRDAFPSREGEMARTILRGCRHALDILGEHQFDLPDPRLPAGYEEPGHTAARYSPSIYSSFARGIMQLLETLAWPRGQDQFVRSLAIGLWMELYPLHEIFSARHIRGIQSRLSVLLLEAVAQNLRHGIGPPVTRLLLSLDGIALPSIAITPGQKLQQEVLNLLQRHFVALPESRPYRISDLLPSNFTYDPQRHVLIQTWADDQRSELQLRPAG